VNILRRLKFEDNENLPQNESTSNRARLKQKNYFISIFDLHAEMNMDLDLDANPADSQFFDGFGSEMSTDQDWIRTEANFCRIRTGSD